MSAVAKHLLWLERFSTIPAQGAGISNNLAVLSALALRETRDPK